ncbi:adenosylcobinamide amidohydrolase [Brevibacillus marinus]|uniref:adenosylcobinamide amidohydrolase n=1 Tax=Brevibacillus marinus TaxID=2496837 RepID=UPI0013E05469|nr:adenosylcobinamide amidohydrolase [Brevibacillus marinus]
MHLPEPPRMPAWNISLDEERVFIRCQEPFRACSNALWNGGLARAQAILNSRVAGAYQSTDPQADVQRMIRQLGADPALTIGMLTAAQVSAAGVARMEGEQFRLCAIVTAGVGNAVRAGRAHKTYPAYQADTINTIVLLDGKLTDAAMLNALITATEAKAAALQDTGVRDAMGLAATGTSTDAVVIAVRPDPQYRHVHLYAGTATTLGDALAKAVYAATVTAVENERKRARQKGEAR